MLSTIKICFALYYENLKSIIKSDTIYDVENMDIKDIEAQVDIIHMKYITISLFSVSRTSVQFEAYIHMTNLIQKYYEINDCEVCDEINKVPENGTTSIATQDSETKKGWFR